MANFRQHSALPIALATAFPILILAAAPVAAKHGVRSIEVGPIWNQMDAERKCPDAARRAGGTWTGDWRTTRPGMSECDIAGGRAGGGGGKHDGWVEAGPIWNQMDAERKCPDATRRAGGAWNGQWRTTRPGEMSECELAGGRGGGGGKRETWIEAGPIWNNLDADRKCPQVAQSVGGKWTGQWKTTRFGQMSVCEVKR
jgi:rubredoxin